MYEPTKDTLRKQIGRLEEALFVAQHAREQAERKLKEIPRLLNMPGDDPKSITRKMYSAIIQRGYEAVPEP
jgi:hypothetical protein